MDQQEIQRQEGKQTAVPGEHHRRRELFDERPNHQAAHREAPAKCDVIDADHAAAHVVRRD